MRRPTFWRRGAPILLMLLALAALLPLQASASDVRSGETVIIAADEVIPDDLIVGATRVIVDGRIKGDLLVAAQTIEINGVVEGDLMAAGASVVINGEVRDDARIAGQALLLTARARVGDDLMAGGMSLEARSGSVVAGSLMFGSAQALLAGDVNERLQGGAEGIELAGRVGGDVEISVGSGQAGAVRTPVFTDRSNMPTVPSVMSGLTVREGASIGGKLDYTTRDALQLPEGLAAGGVIHHAVVTGEPVVTPTDQALATAADLLRRMVTLLLVGLLLLWLAPKWPGQVGDELERKPLASLLSGILSIAAIILLFIVLIVATGVLATTFGAVTLRSLMGLVIVVGILAFVALIVLTIVAVAYIAQIAVGYEIGRLILSRLRPTWIERPIIPLAVGVVILVLAMAIPWVGGLIGLLVVLVGLGALWLIAREQFALRRGLAAVPA